MIRGRKQKIGRAKVNALGNACIDVIYFITRAIRNVLNEPTPHEGLNH